MHAQYFEISTVYQFGHSHAHLRGLQNIGGVQSRAAPIVDGGEQAKGEADAEGHGNCVLGVGGHALEDLARANHRRDDCAKTRLCQHDVSGASGSIRRSCHAPLTLS